MHTKEDCISVLRVVQGSSVSRSFLTGFECTMRGFTLADPKALFLQNRREEEL